MKNFRLVTTTLVLAALFAVGLFLGNRLTRLAGAGATRRVTSGPALLTQIQNLSQLVTVKYVIEKVVLLEDVKWFGENRVLLVAHGVVKAGTDLQRLRPEDIQVAGRKIAVTLPPAQITDAYLDDNETKVVEHTTGLLRAFDKELQQSVRQNAIDDIRRAARTGGILKDAEDQTRAQLTALLRRLGFEEVELRGP
jgi:hypothetical protein